MKNTKRVISLLLALVMVMALAACGTGDAGKTPASSTPSTSTPAAPAEPTKITLGIRTVATVETYEDNKFTQYIEDKLNIDLEFLQLDSTQFMTQLNTMMAGGEKLPDAIWAVTMNADQYTMYGEDGYLLDLAPYFDDPDWDVANEYQWREKFKEWHGEATYNQTVYGRRTADGALYFWPSYSGGLTDAPTAHTYINQVWLDKLGLEMPTTWDELVTVLRAFKTQDPNGNGKADEIPMLGAKYSYSDLVSWIYGNQGVYVNDGKLFNITDDGEIYLPYTTDEYRQATRILRELVAEGLLSEMTWTISATSELPALWTPADGTALVGVMAGHTSLRTTKDSPVLREYVALPPLAEQYVGVNLPQGSTHCFITTDCAEEKLDDVFRLFMEFCEPETYWRYRYGEFGVDWEYATDVESGLQLCRVLNADAYGGQTDSTFAASGPYMIGNSVGGYSLHTTTTGLPEQDPADMNWTDYRSHLLGELTDMYMAHHNQYNPKNIFVSVVYSNEESEENGTSLADITAYVKEQRAKFAVGDIDINSDADWNNYVKVIEGLGAKVLIENTQAAYDRANSK